MTLASALARLRELHERGSGLPWSVAEQAALLAVAEAATAAVEQEGPHATRRVTALRAALAHLARVVEGEPAP